MGVVFLIVIIYCGMGPCILRPHCTTGICSMYWNVLVLIRQHGVGIHFKVPFIDRVAER